MEGSPVEREIRPRTGGWRSGARRSSDARASREGVMASGFGTGVRRACELGAGSTALPSAACSACAAGRCGRGRRVRPCASGCGGQDLPRRGGGGRADRGVHRDRTAARRGAAAAADPDAQALAVDDREDSSATRATRHETAASVRPALKLKHARRHMDEPNPSAELRACRTPRCFPRRNGDGHRQGRLRRALSRGFGGGSRATSCSWALAMLAGSPSSDAGTPSPAKAGLHRRRHDGAVGTSIQPTKSAGAGDSCARIFRLTEADRGRRSLCTGLSLLPR